MRVTSTPGTTPFVASEIKPVISPVVSDWAGKNGTAKSSIAKVVNTILICRKRICVDPLFLQLEA
jgi:hypothetical protein